MIKTVDACQSCGSRDLESVIHLGWQPPCNALRDHSDPPLVEERYPLEMLHCRKCGLAQLSTVLPKEVVFPTSYPYTSSTTRILRENFRDLANEYVSKIIGGQPMVKPKVVVDIGGNDGNLLGHFDDARFQKVNITPEDVGHLSREKGCTLVQDYFGKAAVDAVLGVFGKADLVTATNVFAHVDDVHGFVDQVLRLLAIDGHFCVEAHYLPALLRGTQYDTIYHEHLRYYSLTSLTRLLNQHGLMLLAAKEIPTHGGSIRAWFARGSFDVHSREGAKIILEEIEFFDRNPFKQFRENVAATKASLWRAIYQHYGRRFYGVGAPSRATVLVNYTGLDHNVVREVFEAPGSHRIGKAIPGTRIKVTEEPGPRDHVWLNGNTALVLLSHHVADELTDSIRKKGFAGPIITPLPTVRWS